MKKMSIVGFIFAVLFSVSSASQAASLSFGIGTSLASAKGKENSRTYSDFTTATLLFSITGSESLAFDFGYSQLADISDSRRVSDTETIDTSASINGIFFAGRYFKQLSDVGFGFVKLGVYRWESSVKVSNKDATASSTVASAAEASGSGFSPFVGIGSDFLVSGNDFALRVEFEHIDEIGEGLFDSDSTVSGSTESFLSQGYSYDRLGVSIIIAF